MCVCTMCGVAFEIKDSGPKTLRVCPECGPEVLRAYLLCHPRQKTASPTVIEAATARLVAMADTKDLADRLNALLLATEKDEDRVLLIERATRGMCAHCGCLIGDGSCWCQYDSTPDYDE